MKEKFLITIMVPSIELEFDAYIPNNKKIGTIKKYITQTIYELSENNFESNPENLFFIDRNTGETYKNNIYVKDSKIKSGTKIIVMQY